MRKLAHIEEVHNIRPIDGCDNICQCNILGWNLIIKKNEFTEGDKAVYIEIDSVLPSDNPSFAFLESKNYKIKTMKMRGTISQGIAFPMGILPDGDYKIGDDVTEILKIKQVEDDIPQTLKTDRLTVLQKRFPKLSKSKLFKWIYSFALCRKIILWLFAPEVKAKSFPSFVVKTDETRIQNMPFVLSQYKDKLMIVTEKLDGTSFTASIEKIGKNKFDIAVCSRNIRQPSRTNKCYYESNVYWEMFDKYDIGEVLKKILHRWNASKAYIQGEIIGEKIQKNKYEITGRELYLFNVVIDGERLHYLSVSMLADDYGLKAVPIVEKEFLLPSTVDEMVSYADNNSKLADTLREGIVIRDYESTVSFKAISNKFLLKHNI